MPSLDHEALIQLFRNEPTLAARLLVAAFDADIPAGGAQVLDGNLAQVTPTEYRADLVIAMGFFILISCCAPSASRRRRSWRH